MTIVMALTYIRFFLVIIFALGFIISGPIFALTIFLVAAITDFLDGYLARCWQQETKLGAFLDPVADKCLALTALFFLNININSIILLWCSFIILNREILISNFRAYAAHQGLTIEVSMLGKWKTVFQFFAIIAYLLYIVLTDSMILYAADILLLIAAVLAIFSIFKYGLQIKIG